MGRLSQLSQKDYVYAYKWSKHVGIPLSDLNCRTFAGLGRKLELQEIQQEAEKLPMFFSIDPVMGNLDWGCRFFYLTGSGGCGKSYSAQKWLLNRKLSNPDHVHLYFMRLSDVQVKKLLKGNAMDLIDPDLYRKFGKELKTCGDVVFYGHNEEHTNSKGKTSIHFVKEGELCRIMSLATCFNNKGVGAFDNEMNEEKDEIWMFCDEIVRDEQGGEANRFNIVENFTNQMESFCRSFKHSYVIMCSNLVGDADILAHWNFIPRRPGTYKLKKKKAVIVAIQESAAFHATKREDSLSYVFNKKSNRFASSVQSDGALVASRMELRASPPTTILKFGKNPETWFSYGNGIVRKYKNDTNKQIYSMRMFLDDFYNAEFVNNILDLYNNRTLLFDNITTYCLFTSQIKMVKKGNR